MIKINCSKCSKEYELDEGLDGKVGKCTCGEFLEIKNEEEELESIVQKNKIQLLINNIGKRLSFTIRLIEIPSSLVKQ